MKQIIQTIKGSVRRYEMREVAPNHSRSTDIGGTTYTAEIYVDTEALQYLANRAALNKGGKAKAGPVSVKITKRANVI